MDAKSRPVISIITATFNAAATLRQTIESVLSQTYPYVEYIIIDGGSTDGTVAILQNYSSKLSYWVSEPDNGIYDAFNKGIHVATGDYIQFLGSDDCLYNETILSRVVDSIHGTTDVFSASIYLVDSQWNLQKILDNHSARDKALFAGEMIPHPGMFTKTSLLKKRPFDISFHIAADYDFFLSCYFDEQIRFQYVDFPVAFFSLDGVSGANMGKIPFNTDD